VLSVSITSVRAKEFQVVKTDLEFPLIWPNILAFPEYALKLPIILSNVLPDNKSINPKISTLNTPVRDFGIGLSKKYATRANKEMNSETTAML